jgi:Flp pilus assembly CpaE family ATPase
MTNDDCAASEDQRMRVIIAKEAGVRRDRLRQAILGVGLECGASDCVSYSELPGRLLQGPADLVLVGCEGEPAPSLPVIRQTVAQTRIPVLAIGPAANAEQALQTFRSGAREYLHEEAAGDELLAVLGKLRQAGGADPHWGEILAVIGAKPGVGVTTVACNLAFALARTYPGQVALAEMGPGVPELALDLDLRPTHSVADLAARLDHLDAKVLRQALVEHPARLSVLAHAPGTRLVDGLNLPAVRQILVLLRTAFEFVVVDLGHRMGPACHAALDLSHKIAVVFGLDVPALRLTHDLLQQVDHWGQLGHKVHLVANRYGQRKQFHWKRAQEALKRPIRAWIPDDPGRVNEALNQGKALVQVASYTGIARSFFKLAGRMNGHAAGHTNGTVKSSAG